MWCGLSRDCRRTMTAGTPALLNAMTALEKTAQSFDQLGVSSHGQIAALFGELRSLAAAESAQIRGADSLETFRVKWLGRRDGISSRISENWLKPASPEFKKSI